jgi:hypothetical protein
MRLKPKPTSETVRKENPRLHYKIAASQQEVMAYFNHRTGIVKIGGKVRIIDTEDARLAFYTRADAALLFGHLTVLAWTGEEVNAFNWWLAQDDKRQYNGVTFEPDLTKVPRGVLNLCKGFNVKPKAKIGGWSILHDHMFRNLCRGDQKTFNWLLDWCAHLFQRPGVKIGVAPVLYGSKGCGKSLFTAVLAECVGTEYSPVADNPDLLTGRFNGHLAEALLIRAEEAIHAKDPRHVSRMNNLITGVDFQVERKGIDAVAIKSKANLIFSTNMLHSVPASGDERRYFALHCGDDNRQDGAFFGALMQQMQYGGYGAFMHDLMQRDISKTDFRNPPSTPLLSIQIVSSMTGLDRWWASALTTGALPFVRVPELDIDESIEWPEAGAFEVSAGLIQESATAFARNYAGPPMPEAIGRYLATEVLGLSRGRRQRLGQRERTYVFPPLDECRADFLSSRPGLRLEHIVDPVPLRKPPGNVVPLQRAA